MGIGRRGGLPQVKGLSYYTLLLSHAVSGKTMYLYLSFSPSAVSSVLVREDGGIQRPVYYVSRGYRGGEVRYYELEKLALALVTAARRQRHYF